MPDALILCGGTTGRRAGAEIVELDTSPDAHPSRKVDFSSEQMTAPLLDDLPDIIADAVELAVYVYCADRLVPRKSSNSGRHIGAEWERHFRFLVPVRKPEIWERQDVRSCLVDVLSFLSGDRFVFDFTQSVSPTNVEPFLGFGDSDAQVVRPENVILFSGGLDSLAGIAQEVVGDGSKAILVSHRSANVVIDRQNRLVGAIRQRTHHHQIFHAPVRVRRGTARPREHSQRLRSFLFATLGMAYARMFGQNRVQMFENGITSFNLPVAEHVLGTRASRTTHPKVLKGYERLFSLLLETEVTFDNPFLWRTKTDVVRTIVQKGCSELIPLTTSCASVRNLSMTGVQCGVCSQCVERRIAVKAAGVDELDDAYETDLFVGPIEGATALTMVEGHLLRARRLANMSQTAFLANHGHAFRAFKHMDLPVEVAARRTFDLHERYGREFIQVVDNQFRERASIDGIKSVDPRSLLGMVLPHLPEPATSRDGSERLPPAELKPPPGQPRQLTIALAVDTDRKRIVFANGPEISGVAYRLFEKLAGQRCLDAKVASTQAYIPTRTLAQALGTNEETLRKQVTRVRKNLERLFEEATNYTLDQNDIIQSDRWKGYRLNQNLLVVTMDQLGRSSLMSRKHRQEVTEQVTCH